MKRNKSHFEDREPILEGLFQKLRFSSVDKYIKNNSKLLDLGCGFKGSFLINQKSKISEGTGYDLKVTKQKITNNIKLFSKRLDKNLNLPRNYYDVVTSLAVVEHLDNPEQMIRQVYTTLKNSGSLILTTPSPISKKVLEFLAYRLHIVSEQEIKDHKKYHSLEDLQKMLISAGFKKKNTYLKSFGLGFNNLAVAQK